MFRLFRRRKCCRRLFRCWLRRGSIITLIKPQFEVGRGEVGGGGVVRDPAKRVRVVEEVNEAARALGLEVVNVIESPIQGAEGNVEYLGSLPYLSHRFSTDSAILQTTNVVNQADRNSP